MFKTTENTIGLFDSGVGGLSVLRHLIENTVSSCNFIYLADTARCPYGNRNPHEITSYVEEITLWFNKLGVNQVIIACNTSAALAANIACQISSIPVHDLIHGTASYATKKYERIGVLATSNTCKTKAFSKAILAFNKNCKIVEIPCPDLVPLIESGQLNGQLVRNAVLNYTNKLRNHSVEAVILGCTHFPFLTTVFKELLSDSIELIDPAEHLNIGFPNSPAPDILSRYRRSTYFSTGDPILFAKLAEHYLNVPQDWLIHSVHGITIDDLQVNRQFIYNRDLLYST